MDQSFRHANFLRRVRSGERGTVVLNIDEGPGWVVVWSPNAMCRIRIRDSDTRLAMDSFVETGPASGQAVWVGRLGAEVALVECFEVLDTTFAADQTDGSVVSGLPADPATGAGRAQVFARFFPSVVDTFGDDDRRGQYAPVYGSKTTTIEGTIAAGVAQRIGWPPGERGQAQVHASGSLIPIITSGDPGKVPVTRWTGAPVKATSVDVSPWHFLALDNPGPDPVDFSVVWRDLGSTRQV